MNANLPDFSTATYTAPAQSDFSYTGTEAEPHSLDHGLLLRSVLLGVGGALLGAVLYAGFIHLTRINIGYLSVVIAYLVAKGMMKGSEGRGGRPFQITAVVLTCLAVAIGNALMLYWSLRAEGAVRLSMYNLAQLLRFGFLEPVYEFQDSAASALLTLFILFIGLRAAWRMTSGLPGAVRHPFSRGF